MAEDLGNIKILPDEYDEPGLYLLLKDSTRLELTRNNLDRVAQEFWADPEKIPPGVKDAVEFQRCSFCPLREKHDLCDALRPVLPFMEVMDRFVSYDGVTAVYRGKDPELLHIATSTMQRALRYVSNLSILEYCQAGRQFLKYSFGIIPILGATETASRLYLNIYWVHGGDMEAIDRVIKDYRNKIATATVNQLRRLKMIAKSDAIKNAFVLTHLIPELLDENRDAKLIEWLDRFEEESRYI